MVGGTIVKNLKGGLFMENLKIEVLTSSIVTGINRANNYIVKVKITRKNYMFFDGKVLDIGIYAC